MLKVLTPHTANVNGTSLVGYLKDVTYQQLESVLGKPTYDEPSGDHKVQVEWVCNFLGDVFTIYDWKTYDREFTLNELTTFNVGGKNFSGSEVQEFISYIKDKIEEGYSVTHLS